MNKTESKCCNCSKPTQDEMFCVTCEANGYHHCEKCGEVINNSVYVNNGLICYPCNAKKRENNRI